ncbi:MAG: Crp/Fnr family transcriptional regulator [Bacteroidota bacterium]
MNTAFENYLRQQTELSETDINRISSMATTSKLRRNEFLLREGEVCRHKTFIVSGLLRTFSITPDGNEHILLFSPENTWTLEVESYDREAPARSAIDAIEPSEVLLWNKTDFNSLLEIPQLRKFSEQLISRSIHSSRQRIITALSATPEEKYEDFLQNYPELLSRLPLRMIAAYLGVSLKTLTRIRHAQLTR